MHEQRVRPGGLASCTMIQVGDRECQAKLGCQPVKHTKESYAVAATRNGHDPGLPRAAAAPFLHATADAIEPGQGNSPFTGFIVVHESANRRERLISREILRLAVPSHPLYDNASCRDVRLTSDQSTTSSPDMLIRGAITHRAPRRWLSASAIEEAESIRATRPRITNGSLCTGPVRRFALASTQLNGIVWRRHSVNRSGDPVSSWSRAEVFQRAPGRISMERSTKQGSPTREMESIMAFRWSMSLKSQKIRMTS